MNTDNTRYAPVSSTAVAATKGLPRQMMNQIERNKARLKTPTAKRKRAANYRSAISGIKQVYKGLIVHSEEVGKGKDRLTYIIVLTPDAAATKFCMMMYQVHFRDPLADNYRELAIDISPHVVQRIFQRYAGTSTRAALDLLSALILIPVKLKEAGIWELGTSNGIYVIEITEGDTRHANVKTWIDADKLRPEQSAEAGEYRRIK